MAGVFSETGTEKVTVGQRLEKVLEEHFDRKVHVTCRSMRTVRGLVKSATRKTF